MPSPPLPAFPFSTRVARPEDWTAVARYFRPDEFNHPELVGAEFLLWLRDLRAALGFPLHPTSDARPPARNAAAGGATASAHLDVPCDAVDLGRNRRTGLGLTSAQRFQVVFTAREMGCRRFGIYENGAVHLDRAGDPKAQDVIWVAW